MSISSKQVHRIENIPRGLPLLWANTINNLISYYLHSIRQHFPQCTLHIVKSDIVQEEKNVTEILAPVIKI